MIDTNNKKDCNKNRGLWSIRPQFICRFMSRWQFNSSVETFYSGSRVLGSRINQYLNCSRQSVNAKSSLTQKVKSEKVFSITKFCSFSMFMHRFLVL